MSFFKGIRDYLYLPEDEFEDDYSEDEPNAEDTRSYSKSSRPLKSGKTVSIQATGQMQIMIFRPKLFDDATDAANAIARGRAVVLNLESAEPEECRRILDFLSGAAFASACSVTKVSTGSYIVLPESIRLDESDVQMISEW